MSIVIVFSVSACGKKDNKNSSNSGNENKTEIVKTECNKINQLLKVNYSQLTIEIKTDDSKVSLTSSYEISSKDDVYTVKYSYDKLNSFTIDDNGKIEDPPSQYIETNVVNMKIQNGVIIEQDGDTPENLELDKITSNPGFKFDESYFSNEMVLNSNFTANVKNVKDFMGQEVDCSNMRVTVIYSSSSLSSITLEYISSGKDVKISYNFAQ